MSDDRYYELKERLIDQLHAVLDTAYELKGLRQGEEYKKLFKDLEASILNTMFLGIMGLNNLDEQNASQAELPQPPETVPAVSQPPEENCEYYQIRAAVVKKTPDGRWILLAWSKVRKTDDSVKLGNVPRAIRQRILEGDEYAEHRFEIEGGYCFDVDIDLGEGMTRRLSPSAVAGAVCGYFINGKDERYVHKLTGNEEAEKLIKRNITRWGIV